MPPEQEPLEQKPMNKTSPLPPSQKKQGNGRSASVEEDVIPRSSVRAEKDGVSTPKSRLQTEQAKPYWQASEGKRLAFFDALWNLYPRQENRVEAMQAWERGLGDRIESTPGLDEAIWNGLNEWLVRWQSEDTPLQYIPSFTNWILKERWDDIASPKGVSA
jgi:hypothetical protein